MKKTKKILFTLLMFSICIIKINAAASSSCIRKDLGSSCPAKGIVYKYCAAGKDKCGNAYYGYGTNKAANDIWYLYTQDNTPVFCIGRGVSLASLNTTCTLNNSDNGLRAAIGYVLANGGNFYDDSNYEQIQRIIWKLQNSSYNYSPSGNYNTIYQNALSVKTNYNNGVAGTYYLANFYSCGSKKQPITYGTTPETIPPKYTLDVNPVLDGTKYNSGISEYTFDVYINGTQVSNDVIDYYNTSLSSGTTYELKDFKTPTGHTYISGTISGTIYSYTEVTPSWVTNKVNIAYHPNGGTTSLPKNQWGWVIYNEEVYFHTIYYGNSDDPYNASTLGITRSGYTFNGWEVDASYKLMNQDTTYSSTEYVDNSDKNKTTANTETVYAYLRAKWEPKEYTVIYHGGGDGKLQGLTVNKQSSVSDSIKYDEIFTVRDGKTLFTFDDHTFIGWTTNPDGETDDGYGWTGWSGKWVYTDGQFGINNSELHLYARWEDSCVYEFKTTYNNNPTPLQRLNLYTTYHSEPWNSSSRRNLLNFEISDAETACGNYTPDYDSQSACLSTDQVNETTENRFTDENLSDYNDRIISSSVSNQSYCLTDFELTKGTNVIYDSNMTVKAGRMIFNIDKYDNVAFGTLTKTCYIHKDVFDNYSANITQEHFIKPDNYLSIVTLDGVELNGQFIKSQPTSILEGNFYKVEGIATIEYKPNPIYTEKITGLQKNKEECTNGNGTIKDSCRVLGYGVASKFNDGKKLYETETIPLIRNFNFSISTPSTSIFTFDTGSTCEYKVEPEVIEYEQSGDKGNLEIEFRTIDTNNPFNRNTKSNWSGTTNSSTNNVVQQYITNNDVNNSYNKTGEGSLYTNQTDGTKRIILTPDLVQKIREYNATHSYDDYTVYKETVEGKEKTSTSFFDYIGLTKVQ